MRELSGIVRAFEQARLEDKATALASVVSVEGSAYRRPGARMLVTEDGQTTGTVSGGCLERDVMLRARRAIERGDITLATYDTTDEDDLDFGVGLGCRGVIQVLIEPLPRACEPSYLPLLDELCRRRETGVLATVWRMSGPIGARYGSRLLLGGSGRLWDDIGDPRLAARIDEDAREALRGRRSSTRTYALPGGHAEVFLELLQPPIPLVIFGGGHDVVPLVRFAGELGWHVTVVNGRPVAASRARFPSADAVLLCRPDHVTEEVRLGGDAVAVVMTHNYRLDLRLLEVLLPSPVRYLGVLGPKSRTERLLQELSDMGIAASEAQRRKLHAPVGLDIGADTAEEIALAIVAEIRATLAGRVGGPLRDRQTPMHERGRPLATVRPLHPTPLCYADRGNASCAE
jgi:xanthine dehydrogenase accessory factor